MSTAATIFINKVSIQSVIIVVVSLIAIFSVMVVSFISKVPRIFMAGLTLCIVFVAVFQSVVVNCMVIGGCEMFAWLQTAFAMFFMVIVFMNVLRFAST